MTTFRYHIVSLVSVLLALAIGIALGGGPLKGEVDNSVVQSLRQTQHTAATQQVTISQQQDFSKFADAVVRGEEGRVLSHRLDGVRVALVELPGADATTTENLARLVRLSGGQVVGHYRIQQAMIRASSSSVVAQVARRTARQHHGVTIPPGASPYETLGTLLARAIGAQVSDGALPYDSTSSSILDSLDQAGLASSVTTPSGRADAVLYVSGSGNGRNPDGSPIPLTSDQKTSYGDLAVLTSSLAEHVGAAVVAGPQDSARIGGFLMLVRTDVQYSSVLATVDSAETETGAVVAMLAIEQDLRAGTGQYGAVAPADGALPGGG